MLAATIRDIDLISKKRNDRRWLSKRMSEEEDVVGRALAGSLLAAGEADTSTVLSIQQRFMGLRVSFEEVTETISHGWNSELHLPD